MDLAELFNDTIALQSQTGSGTHGDPTWGAQRTIQARIQTELRRVATAAGEARVPVDVLMTDQPILAGDRYWPPGADTSDNAQAKRLGKITSAASLDGDCTLWKVDL